MTENAGLRRNVLGLPDILFQGITHIAPAAGLIFTLPFIATYTGAAMPVALVLSLIVCLMIASTVAEFTKFLPSAGGYFTFVARGLGPALGFIAGWAFFLYAPLGGPANVGILSGIAEDSLKTNAGIDIPWIAIALILVAVVWVLTYFGVKISARSMLILGTIELVIMIALGVSLLISPAAGSSAAATVDPGSAKDGINGILFGMVYSILAMSGFEAVAPMTEETRDPKRIASRAILGSLLIVGIYYIAMSFAVAIGWGTDKIGDFTSTANPFNVLADRVWGSGWVLVFLALINSALGVSIAAMNAGSRVMFAMGRIGVLPSWLAFIHPDHKTPTNAINLMTVISLALIIGVGYWQSPANVYGWLGPIITVGIIVMYSLANISLVVFMRREHPDQLSTFRHIVLPIAGTLLLLPVLWVTFIPVPAYPFNLCAYIVVAWLVIGAIVAWRLSTQSPDAMKRATQTFETELS